MNYYITIKITFERNSCDNPNDYTLSKAFRFSCASYHFSKGTIKVNQNHHEYSFDLDEIDELYIKLIQEEDK